MKSLEEITIKEQEVGYCIVPAECINKTGIQNKSEYEIGAYIPKLMTEIEMRDKPYIDTASGLKSDMIVNKKFPIRFPEKIKLCNFVRISPQVTSNTSPPILMNGEKFFVEFINQDIKKPTYTGVFTDEEIRENDLYEISVKRTKEDKTVDKYSLYLNGIKQKAGIKLTDDIFIDLNEEHSKITIKYGSSNIVMKDNKIDIVSNKVELGSSVNISGKFTVNGRTLEEIIDARCASHSHK